MRKTTLFAAVFAFFVVPNFAIAQQGDAMLGFGTITSPGSVACNTNSGCPEKGGLYPNVSADVIFHRRMGIGFDVAWKASQGAYGGPGGVPFRPILLDFNGVYQPRLSKKAGLDLMAGIGWQATRFYSGNYQCNYFSCTNFVSSHHFLMDVGGGIRFYVRGNVFVRPEAHYYWINNNTADFNSNNIVRVGASIGYTIGGPN